MVVVDVQEAPTSGQVRVSDQRLDVAQALMLPMRLLVLSGGTETIGAILRDVPQKPVDRAAPAALWSDSRRRGWCGPSLFARTGGV